MLLFLLVVVGEVGWLFRVSSRLRENGVDSGPGYNEEQLSKRGVED